MGSAGKHGPEINRPKQLRALAIRLKKQVLFIKPASMAGRGQRRNELGGDLTGEVKPGRRSKKE